MAQAVSEKMDREAPLLGQIGCQLLEVITTGMYCEPRMAIREYIQNAADAIDLAEEQNLLKRGSGRINVRLDGRTRSITVFDNGVGVANVDIGPTLGSVGISGKVGTRQRGFRGIGRLGGIAYCDSVVFETRSEGDEFVGVVEWDGRAMRESIARSSASRAPDEVIRETAKLDFRPPVHAEPPRFFRATLRSVRPFHRDELMNPAGMAEYVAQVAPVPLSRRHFRFARRVEKHVSHVHGYRCYEIRVNGERVVRPIADVLTVTRGDRARIHDVKLFEVAGSAGQPIGRGWYAVTDCSGSVSRSNGARGLRVRQGNMQIGDEYCLADLFTERRFATWHIGEIHLDSSLRPNARRDGFENSPDYEHFLEQAQLLARHLSWLCRRSSVSRGAARSAELRLREAEQRLAVPFFIDEEHMRSVTAAVADTLDDLATAIQESSLGGELTARVDAARERVDSARTQPLYLRSCLDRRRLRRLQQEDVIVGACKTLAQHSGNGQWVNGPIMAFLAPYLKPTALDELKGSSGPEH